MGRAPGGQEGGRLSVSRRERERRRQQSEAARPNDPRFYRLTDWIEDRLARVSPSARQLHRALLRQARHGKWDRTIVIPAKVIRELYYSGAICRRGRPRSRSRFWAHINELRQVGLIAYHAVKGRPHWGPGCCRVVIFRGLERAQRGDANPEQLLIRRRPHPRPPGRGAGDRPALTSAADVLRGLRPLSGRSPAG